MQLLYHLMNGSKIVRFATFEMLFVVIIVIEIEHETVAYQPLFCTGIDKK